MTVETVRHIIEGAETDAEIKQRLDDAEFVYQDLTEESGYMNLRIPARDGYIRIYRSRDGVKVNKFERVNISYSGIPTFEPSGRRSF